LAREFGTNVGYIEEEVRTEEEVKIEQYTKQSCVDGKIKNFREFSEL